MKGTNIGFEEGEPRSQWGGGGGGFILHSDFDIFLRKHISMQMMRKSSASMAPLQDISHSNRIFDVEEDVTETIGGYGF